MIVGEVSGGVPISGGEDEPAKVNGRTTWRHKRAPARVPAISLCRMVGEEEKAGEVDADIKVVA